MVGFISMQPWAIFRVRGTRIHAWFCIYLNIEVLAIPPWAWCMSGTGLDKSMYYRFGNIVYYVCTIL